MTEAYTAMAVADRILAARGFVLTPSEASGGLDLPHVWTVGEIAACVWFALSVLATVILMAIL